MQRFVVGFAFVIAACGSSSNNNATDASVMDASSGGGNDAGTAAPSCNPSFGTRAECGGDATGTWTYRAACGALAAEAQIRQACGAALFGATTHNASGSLEITATTYDLSVSDQATLAVTVPAACSTQFGGCTGTETAIANSTGGQASCTDSANGCECTVSGTIAAIENGSYTVASQGVLTTMPAGGGGADHNYCVEGNTLRYRRAGDGVVYVLTR